MRKKLVQLSAVSAMVAFIVWISFFGRAQNADLFVDKIRGHYKGVIVEIYHDRVTNLKIQTESGDFVNVGMLSGELIASVSVGDSIEKIANENYVYVIKDGRRLKTSYLHIPESIRGSKSWPEEWNKDSIFGHRQ